MHLHLFAWLSLVIFAEPVPVLASRCARSQACWLCLHRAYLASYRLICDLPDH